MVGHLGSAIFLFLNVEITDSSSKKFQEIHPNSVCNPILVAILEPYSFIYLFSVQIRNQHLRKPEIKNPPTNPPSVNTSIRIPVKAKSIKKIWNSSRVFFSYIIYYKILSVSLQWIFRSAKFNERKKYNENMKFPRVFFFLYYLL